VAARLSRAFERVVGIGVGRDRFAEDFELGLLRRRPRRLGGLALGAAPESRGAEDRHALHDADHLHGHLVLKTTGRRKVHDPEFERR